MILTRSNTEKNKRGSFFRFQNKNKKNFVYSSFKGWTCLEIFRFKVNKSQNEKLLKRLGKGGMDSRPERNIRVVREHHPISRF